MFGGHYLFLKKEKERYSLTLAECFFFILQAWHGGQFKAQTIHIKIIGLFVYLLDNAFVRCLFC
ncbi:hypothetical protein HDF26_000480 [Pedobacter cryoconitis]|uniref:Uncharacterized protein n=1 Tax=Pedobacter cryoconitis TaxID=188932 RepID=A0A7W9E033_9SPHI|nr:hypothetical protein [Pedobacter cryoconitis]MBB6270053.1 hypothetical protein [Pedobacter cryoconitis]